MTSKPHSTQELCDRVRRGLIEMTDMPDAFDAFLKIERLLEQLEAAQREVERWQANTKHNAAVVDDLQEQKEALDDALRDILDVTENWTRFKTDPDKLNAIAGLAKAALEAVIQSDPDTSGASGLPGTASNQHSELMEFDLSAELRIGASVLPPQGDAKGQMERWADRAQSLEEQFEALNTAAREWIEMCDRDDNPAYPAATLQEVDRLQKALRDAVSFPASIPLDPRFPNHVEGCICPRFKDIAPDLIADLTCPVHGVNGTHPGDVLSERSPASEPEAS